MKVRIDIDCTPEEARTFFGLPDVAPMQKALTAQMQERLSATLASADPETMLRTWLPVGMQNLEKMQEMFWAGMGRAGRPGDKPKGG